MRLMKSATLKLKRHSEPLQLQEWVMEMPSSISGLDARPGLPFGITIIRNHAFGLYAMDDPDVCDLAKKWMDVNECFAPLTADSITRAFNLLRELADEGDQTAMTAMTLLSAEIEPFKSIKLLETGAQMGCPIAMTCFAMFVMGTMGTEDLHPQARSYLEQAAETGMPRAREWRGFGSRNVDIRAWLPLFLKMTLKNQRPISFLRGAC